MKVILINGSPHARGCTYTALSEVARGLTDHGVDAEIIPIGCNDIPGCRGCFACRRLGKCVIDDVVNETAEKLKSADGMIIASPVYFASPNASLVALLDRLYAAHGNSLMYKPCGCIVSARRAGTTAALEVLHKYAMVNEQPLVPSSYWCMVHGNTPDEVRADTEGMEIAYNLGRNMAWMVKALRDMPCPEKLKMHCEKCAMIHNKTVNAQMEIIDFYKSGQQQELISKIAGGDWPPCQLLAELLESGQFQEAVKGGTVYLLMDGESIVSFLTFSRQDCVIDEKLYPWAGFVYTFPEYRGNRYVGKLLAHAEEEARKQGCQTVYIATDHIGLYEKYGYAYWESRIDMYQEECRIYIKKLCVQL